MDVAIRNREMGDRLSLIKCVGILNLKGVGGNATMRHHVWGVGNFVLEVSVCGKRWILADADGPTHFFARDEV